MEDESSEDDEFAQELQAVELAVPEQITRKASYVNNKLALVAKLEEIKLSPTLPWIEKLDFVCPKPLEVENAQDDLKRETAFYSATMACTKMAIVQFEQARIPYMRPADFFAEMIKPDAQMQRIKDSLLHEKARINLSAARKKQKEQKKYAQEVHANKLKDRSKAKKSFVEGLKTTPRAGEEKSLVGPINEALKGSKKNEAAHGMHGQQVGSQKKSKGKKRVAADKKYGYGGQTKRQRMNDRSSAADDSGYNPNKNKRRVAGVMSHKFKGGKAEGSARNKGAKRPGKSKRMAMRQH